MELTYVIATGAWCLEHLANSGKRILRVTEGNGLCLATLDARRTTQPMAVRSDHGVELTDMLPITLRSAGGVS